MKPLAAKFYARPTLAVARDLLGQVLVHDAQSGRIAGRIVETEGYLSDDPAMHGWRATFGEDGVVLPVGRAADLFRPPGTAYVYLIYRTNWLLNIVTEPEGTAGAVLIRALEPIEGLDQIRRNRPPSIRRDVDLTNGPGKLTQALDIASREWHGVDMTRPPLCVLPGHEVPDRAVDRSARIGLRKGVELPYRFFVADSPYVSPGVPSDEAARRREAG